MVENTPVVSERSAGQIPCIAALEKAKTEKEAEDGLETTFALDHMA